MRIVIVGNTNNFPMLVGYMLREFGHEVTLIVDAQATDHLHRPEAHLLPMGTADWVVESREFARRHARQLPELFAPNVMRLLRSADAVVANGLGHGAVVTLASSIPSYHLFSGADLDVMADPIAVSRFFQTHWRLRRLPAAMRSALARCVVARHRMGIRRAAGYSYFPEGLVPSGDRLLATLFPNGSPKRFAHCHVLTDGIDLHPMPERTTLRLFNLTRFLWKEPLPAGCNPEENKRNDVLVRGLALYRDQGGPRIDVRFVEKGRHVEETKALLGVLGLASWVTWLPEMSFRAVMDEYREADLVTEQFGNHVFTGGLYPMLVGRPVIGNARPEIMEKLTGESAPVAQARTAEEVALWLRRLVDSRTLRADMGARAHAYVRRHFDIRDEARFVINVLEESRQRARRRKA